MSASDFLLTTKCYLPCVRMEVELIKYTELNYPYFPDGANSMVLVLVSNSIIVIE